MRLVSVFMLTSALFLTVSVGEHTVRAADRTSDAQNGLTVFQANCVTCHGESGKGDGPTGAYLSVPPADLTSEDVRNDSDSELLSEISNGIPDKGMPAWKSSLSVQEIRDVLAYIRTLSATEK